MGDLKEKTQRVPIGESRVDPGNYYLELLKKEEEFLEKAVKAKERLVVPCRPFVFPQYNGINVELENGLVDTIPMIRVFDILEIPRDQLLNIYETTVSDEGRVELTGFFRPDGKQALANTLGTEVLFLKQLGSDSMLDYTSDEIFIPEEKV